MCLIKHTQKTLAIKTYKLGKQDLGSGCETVLSTASALKIVAPSRRLYLASTRIEIVPALNYPVCKAQETPCRGVDAMFAILAFSDS